jgi:2'-5' RNA ligase
MSSSSGPVKVNLFYAVRPPWPVCLGMEKLARDLGRAYHISRPVTVAQRLHNTMAPIDCRHMSLESAVARARQAAAEVRFPAFPVRYELTGSFTGRPGNHPLVLRGDEGLASLRGLREQLVTEMHRAHLRTDHGYTPHITLLWGDRMVDDNPVLPFEWIVEEFILVLSVIGHSHHEELGRWRLH